MAYVVPKNTWIDDEVYNASDQNIMANDLIDHEARVAGKLDTTAAPELIRDTMGTALVAGPNVTITPSDVGDTITISSTGGGGGGSIDGGGAAGAGTGTIDGGTAA